VVSHGSLSCPGKKRQGAEQKHHMERHEIRRGHCPQDPHGEANHRAKKQRRRKSLTVHKVAPETGNQLQEEGLRWPGSRANGSGQKGYGCVPICTQTGHFLNNSATITLCPSLFENLLMPEDNRRNACFRGTLGGSRERSQNPLPARACGFKSLLRHS